MVTLGLLAGIAVFLFAMEAAHNSKAPKPSQENIAGEAISTGVTETDTISFSLSSIPEETSIPVAASLSNDQDHDGNYDGIADALIGLCGLVVLRVYFVLLMPLAGRIILRLCEPLILFSSDYYLALEHPG
jgi:hypothetical protein